MGLAGRVERFAVPFQWNWLGTSPCQPKEIVELTAKNPPLSFSGGTLFFLLEHVSTLYIQFSQHQKVNIFLRLRDNATKCPKRKNRKINTATGLRVINNKDGLRPPFSSQVVAYEKNNLIST